MRLFKKLLLFLPLLTFALKVEGVPTPYKSLFKGLPLEGKLQFENFDGSFKALLVQETPSGRRYVEIYSGNLLDFYKKLYALSGKQPREVSITIYYKGSKVPYNPFFQVWDTNRTVKILSFANLKRGCKPPIIGIEAKGVSGARIIVPFKEIEESLFRGGFKYPVYYCY